MEICEVMNSEKRHTGYFPRTRAENSSDNGQRTSTLPVSEIAEDVVYKLYFKGLTKYENATDCLVKKAVAAGFGLVICDHADKVIFMLNEKLDCPDINDIEIEITALVRGLKESFDLRIRRIMITTYAYEVYQFIIGKNTAMEERLDQLMEEVRSLREKFAYSEAIRVHKNENIPALKLAKETVVCQNKDKKSKRLGTILLYDIAEHGDYDDYNPANGCGCPCDFYEDDIGFVDYEDYYSL